MKKLGQNFLTDENIKKKILETIIISKNDIILELGAGNGAISEHISKKAKKAFFIEIDNSLITSLERKINTNNNVKIYNEDILKFNLKDLIKKYKNIRIIGNIPYNITSKILNFLEKFSENIKDIHLVIQKDFAEKITNKQKDSGISLILNYKFKITKIFDIKPNSFKPAPKILSSLIKLEPNFNKKYIINYDFFKKIIKLSFEYRRKKIKKTINYIEKINKYINVEKRPEELTVDNYIRLSNLMFITKS